MTDRIKPPVWFWIVGSIALLWNLLGVQAYIMQVTMSSEAIAALPEAERALYEDLPTWATAAFATAVWGGAFASLVLLLRKSIAYHLFILSLIGIVIQMIYNVFISNSIEVYGPGGFVMPVMVFIHRSW